MNYQIFRTNNRVVKGGGGVPNHESRAYFPSNHESRIFLDYFTNYVFDIQY